MRDTGQRKADALARLERDENVWLSTASGTGVPHMIPLSLAWDGIRILVATPTESPTVRNARANGSVKAALDSTIDVVLVEGAVEVVDFDALASADLESFVERVGWDPRTQDGAWSMLFVTPQVIRSWNSVAEIRGRTIMRDGAWLA